MAIQILCLACRVSIEAEESPNWEVVPCFSCRAPLRMPVAVQKTGNVWPAKIDLPEPPTDLRRDPLASKSTLDSSDKPRSTPVVPNKPSKPILPLEAQLDEPPPFVPATPVPVRATLENSPTPASPSRVKPVERRNDKKGSSADSGRGIKYKLTLLLGYLLFVVIPIGGVIVAGVNYIKRMDETGSPPEQAPITQEDPGRNKPEPKRANTGMLAIPEGFTSDWEKLGPVEVRIAGVAIGHVPIVNVEKKLAAESPLPVLAIWVDTRVVAADKTIELRRWQSPSEQACRLTTDQDEELRRADLGPGAILRTGTPSKQLLGPNSRARVELLIFTPPTGEVKSLTLTLDAAHVGEVGNINLTIPGSALKK